MTHEKAKHCPFNHTNCIEDRCALWVMMTTHTQGPIPEVRQKQEVGVCTFVALLQAAVASANKPPMMMAPAQMRRPMVGG